MVLLIGRTAREIFSTNQEHYPDLGSNALSVWKRGLFSQAVTLRSCYSPWLKSSCVPSPTAADLHTIVEELPAAWTEATADS